MGRFSDSLMKRGASIRRSLTFRTKKVKNCIPESLVSVSEGPAEEKNEEKKEEEEVVREEIEEAYTLPEIPHTPLSGTVSVTCFLFFTLFSCYVHQLVSNCVYLLFGDELVVYRGFLQPFPLKMTV